ncbi:MAG: hypothetical protein JWQ04_651 [Pedosphaera sp.]|nr:hypothetical protein [Pedosphaera sp.]
MKTTNVELTDEYRFLLILNLGFRMGVEAERGLDPETYTALMKRSIELANKLGCTYATDGK